MDVELYVTSRYKIFTADSIENVTFIIAISMNWLNLLIYQIYEIIFLNVLFDSILSLQTLFGAGESQETPRIVIESSISEN